jgi:peptidoglycan/LPS O-acetylase OafA/YrhL
VPALDGLRGAAVLVVLVHHAGPTWLPGGFLGVTWFFALSGFLITRLLLVELEAAGRVDLGRFFGRRARRLVPAALVGIALAAFVGLGLGSAGRRAVGPDAAAGLLSVVNWRYALGGHEYAQAFGDPSPLQHLWSLGIEEQLYLGLAGVFVVLGVLRLSFGRRRVVLASVLAAAIAASVASGTQLFRIGQLPWRAYFGTDVRAAEPLLGALLAVVLAGARGIPTGRRVRRLVGALGAAAAVGLAFTARSAQAHDLWLYRGGFALVAVLTCGVIVAALDERSSVAWVLSARPLRAAGRVSYGAYVVHWPLFLWLDGARTGLGDGPLLVLRLGATFALATVSLIAIEAPIRAGRLTPTVARGGWAAGALAVASLGAAVAVAAPASLTTLDRTGDLAAPIVPRPMRLPSPGAGGPDLSTTTVAVGASGSVARSGSQAVAAAPARPPVGPSGPPASVSSRPSTPGALTRGPHDGPLRVVLVGDSQAENLATGLAAWGTDHDVEVYDLSVGGCTLGRGGQRRLRTGLVHDIPGECAWWDWDGSPRWKALYQARPDVIVVLTGMNDSFDRKQVDWPTWRAPGQEGFRTWNGNEYRKAYRMLATSGAVVAAVVPPCDDWTAHPDWQESAEGDRRMRLMATEVVRPSAAAVGAPLLDEDAVLCPGGRFVSDPLGVPAARPDGFHLTDHAATVLADRWLGPEVLRLAGR